MFISVPTVGWELSSIFQLSRSIDAWNFDFICLSTRTMSAQTQSGLAGVWQALRETKQQDLAPHLLRHGVRGIADISSVSAQLMAEGVPPWKLELLAVRGHSDPLPERARWDIPASRPSKRASLQAAVEAAQPNNRRRCLEALERDILANTTQPVFDSKVRTYLTVCQAWQVAPWPITMESLQFFAASMKEGAYKSSQGFFQSVFTYQRRHLQIEVSQLLKGAAKDYARSISRGLGPSSLKDSFDVEALINIGIEHDIQPFSMESPPHGRDLLVVACWFMMRELEVASCQWSHIYIEGTTVNLMLPVQKNDTAGSLTIRSLRCACRIRLHPLCPVHAARRHLQRVRAHESFRAQCDFPMVPDSSGRVPTKHYMVQFFRMIISASGTPTVRPNAEGVDIERFAGHVARVSGAQWLSRLGMGSHQIQLLGRWSSAAVERYLQMAPLLQVEHSSGQLLHPESAARGQVRQEDLCERPGLVGPSPVHVSDSDDNPAHVEPPASQSADGIPSVAVSDLQNQLASLRQVIMEPAQVLVHRYNSYIVHLGSVSESGNNPIHWRTRCGWSYGMTNFYRVQSMQSGFRGCRKCFRDSDCHIASESDGSSDSSKGGDASTSSGE